MQIPFQECVRKRSLPAQRQRWYLRGKTWGTERVRLGEGGHHGVYDWRCWSSQQKALTKVPFEAKAASVLVREAAGSDALNLSWWESALCSG